MSASPLFCASCGGKLAATWIDADSRQRLACTICRTVHYENTRILVTCLVEHEGRLLMCQRRDDPGRGFWTPPAGFMEQRETLEEAAVREVKEETGVTVDPTRLDLYMISNVPWMSEVYVGFRAFAEAPDITIGPECTDARFIAEADIPWEQLAFAETSGLLRLFFHERNVGAFSIHLTRIDASGGHRRAYAINGSRDVFEPNTPTSRPTD